MVSSDVPASEEQGEIVVLSDGLSEIGSLSAPFALRDMHELKWYGGKLWVTCAFDNMIAIFDGRTWDRWFPLGQPAVEPYDRHHVNSLYFENDTIIVLAHNWGKSCLHFFTLSTLTYTDTMSMGVQAHNIWRQNAEYCTCSSGEGTLVGSKSFYVETGGFPRGVAKCEGIICVGISEWAERADRDFTTATLRFFNSDWRHLSDIALSGEGLVLDIQPYRRYE